MTTTNKDCQEKISAHNPQGTLPEIPLPSDYKEEQMEFTIANQVVVTPSDSFGEHPDLSSSLAPITTSISTLESSSSELMNLDDELGNELLLSVNLENEPLENLPAIDSLEAPLMATEPLSMPAALCDDQLLQELNTIPDKMGFKIGDVADLLGIKQYVLRYWESEFEILKPKKAHNNQRLYTKKDVENAFLIRKLLHRDRFSIEGARTALKGLKAFVKKENLKEKEIKQVIHKIDSFQERLENLAFDVRRVRQFFK